MKLVRKVALIKEGIITSILDYDLKADNPEAGLVDITFADPMPVVGDTYDPENVLEDPIWRITSGAMQRRFTIEEEAAILDHGPTVLRVVRERLINSVSADVIMPELIEGIHATVDWLSTQDRDVVEGEEGYGTKIVTDPATRKEELLKWGDEGEAYIGE